MVEIIINGEVRAFSEETSLAEVIETLEMPHKRVAVELNGAVVPRRDWPEAQVADGDRLEVVHFVGGG